MPSESSSADDLCVCGADRGAHKIIHSHVFIGEDLEPPGSGDSSKDECEGGCVIYTKPPCASRRGCICGGEWWTHGCKHSLPPPGSASSSPDEKCFCGHRRREHEQEQRSGGPSGAVYRMKCNRCFTHGAPLGMLWQHDFVPAEPDPTTSAMHELCSCGHARHLHRGGWCRRCPMGECVQFTPAEPEAPTAAQDAAMDELTHLRQEMEATEAEPCLTWLNGVQCAGTRRHPGDCTPNADDIALPEPPARGYDDSWHDSSPCEGCGHFVLDHIDGACKALGCPCGHDVPEPEAPECGALDSERCCPMGCQVKAAEREQNRLELQAMAPPRRPPYAVAYAIEGGAQYEIALPGDATIRAHEGALIITHASAVLALTQARPMEGA